MVPAGAADLFQVVVLAARADAFLAGGGAHVVAFLDAQEDVFELVHAGVGKEQRRVVRRDERGRAHHAMPAAGKKVQKSFSNIVRSHSNKK